MPSYAQPAVLLTDTNSSSAVRDSTTAYKNRATALFVPLCCCQHGSEPAQPNRNPIDLTASAANASGSLQTTLSKLPDHDNNAQPHLISGQFRSGSVFCRI